MKGKKPYRRKQPPPQTPQEGAGRIKTHMLSIYPKGTLADDQARALLLALADCLRYVNPSDSRTQLLNEIVELGYEGLKTDGD